jgi:hypothetical protein
MLNHGSEDFMQGWFLPTLQMVKQTSLLKSATRIITIFKQFIPVVFLNNQS